MSYSRKGKLLIVDDDEQIRTYLRTLLSREGYEIIQANDGKDALIKVRDFDPDLVLLDVMMPQLDGLEVCRILKSRKEVDFLPVILLTARDDMESRVEGLKLGADDYISKPADPQELMDRIEVLLRIKALQDKITSSIEQDQGEKTKDKLTGLYSANYLVSRLNEEFQRAERYSEPLSCIMVSINGFQAVRLEKHQDAADRLVLQVTEIVQNSTREFDVVIRSQDSQFVILLPRTHVTGSLSVASRIWQKAQLKIRSIDKIEVGVNMGVSFYPNRDVISERNLIEQAKLALEKASKSGNNQICFFQHMAYLYQPDLR